ncbi:uncharacterized protein F4822DRAFT_443927 [Hypoxylon trugodes]|uniref:uncharacterized protein n=1 Tax=Hypoxylon trugodes TaxID=326681 RepID=UPI00219E526D|nr:uncharacterized protein F4822DRAFT_443927 [Hypoxylon trugodes]KAI1387098.1 hypothetical protein F4822DRAFT_443927 [Hypoxylon trugodes]
MALAPTLRQRGMMVMVRDITMAYTQSQTPLQRLIFVHLPSELKNKYPEGTLLHPSAFDPCLLIAKADEPFGVTGLQTDDTLNIGTLEFLKKENEALVEVGIKAKPQKILENGMTEDFNGSRMRIHEEGYGLSTTQKGQAEKLELLDPKGSDMQMDNKDRGLNYMELDPQDLRLYIFVDGSFANNRDMSSQIGYIVVLGNEKPTTHDNELRIDGNVIHWSSTKCKRVTRSVLASEIYGMVQGFDIGYVVHHTINTVLGRLSFPRVPLVLCTDSYSLYQCLVQMGSTNKKRLMIDLMALRQSYENREINDIRWIQGNCNPADAMTKASPNEAMKTLIEENGLTIKLEGWVKRE